MKRCAWIKSDKDQGEGSCPFGLPIVEGCQFAGDSVAHMCPLETMPKEKREDIEKANKRVYIYYKTNDRCMYAANVIIEQNVVNCDFGDSAAGMSMPAFSGSPLYPQTFSGIGLDGLYAFPLGFYADNNESRNLFQGLFSLVGSRAYEFIKSGAVLPEQILEKISNNEPLTTDEQFELVEALSKCRQKFDENTTDPGTLDRMIKMWDPNKHL